MEAAFFDLDKTVIDRASIAAFGRPFLKGGLINRRLVARAAVSQLIYLYFGADEERLARVRESMLAVTKGWDRAQVRQIVRETMLETMEPIMYAEALELMELRRAGGDRLAAGRPARRRRGHLLARRGRRPRPLHGTHGLLRVRRRQGGGHTGAGRAHGTRPVCQQRLLGLRHRPPDARGGRAPGRGEPG